MDMTGALTMQDDFSPLRAVLVRHARDAFVDQSTVDAQWQRLNFLEAPDYSLACRDSDAFIDLLEHSGATVIRLPADSRLTIDSVYARDAAVVCDRGVILSSMGKPNRQQEPDVLHDFLVGSDIPVAGRITGEGRVEGGDVAWIDRRTIAVAQGYRTNAEGIRQLREILGPDIEVIVVALPHWNGPSDVLHLMSFFSPVGPASAVVYSRLMPVPFRQMLLARGWELIEVSDAEYDTLGCNVLAIAPKVVMVSRGNPQLTAALHAAGCEVIEYAAREISWKGSGGPTCLTRPLWRAACPG